MDKKQKNIMKEGDSGKKRGGSRIEEETQNGCEKKKKTRRTWDEEAMDESLKGLERVCPNCKNGPPNIKFFMFANGKTSQPRYKCKVCPLVFTLGGKQYEKTGASKKGKVVERPQILEDLRCYNQKKTNKDEDEDQDVDIDGDEEIVAPKNLLPSDDESGTEVIDWSSNADGTWEDKSSDSDSESSEDSSQTEADSDVDIGL